MEYHKLKIKIGDNEFEAEAPQEVVQAQFEAFKEMITNASLIQLPKTSTAVDERKMGQPETNNARDDFENKLGNIMQADGRVVSLTVPVQNIHDAILLIIYGQKKYRSNPGVTGGEIMDGLKATGMGVERVDRLLVKAHDKGHVIAMGKGRSKRYRLTNKGAARCRDVAKQLIAVVA